MDVMPEFAVLVYGTSIVPNQTALGNGAPQPSIQGEGVSNTVMVGRKCARLKAAPLLPQRAVSAPSTVRMESASLQAAPLVWYLLKNRIATDTAEARRSCAPWRTAPPSLYARVFAPSTAAEEIHALLQVAPTRWSASS